MFSSKKARLGIDVLENGCNCILYHPSQKKIIAAQSFSVDEKKCASTIKQWLKKYNSNSVCCLMSVPNHRIAEYQIQAENPLSDQEIFTEIMLYADVYFPAFSGDLCFDFYSKFNEAGHVIYYIYAMERNFFNECKSFVDIIQKNSLYVLEPEALSLVRAAKRSGYFQDEKATLIIFYIKNCFRYVLFDDDVKEKGCFYCSIEEKEFLENCFRDLSHYLSGKIEQVLVFNSKPQDNGLFLKYKNYFDCLITMANIKIYQKQYPDLNQYLISMGLVLVDAY